MLDIRKYSVESLLMLLSSRYSVYIAYYFKLLLEK